MAKKRLTHYHVMWIFLHRNIRMSRVDYIALLMVREESKNSYY